MSYKIISAEEAASHIHNGDNVGFSGFTAAGSPKAVSEALAKKANEKHEKGIPFQVGVFSGASTSDHLRLPPLAAGTGHPLRFSGRYRHSRYRSLRHNRRRRDNPHFRRRKHTHIRTPCQKDHNRAEQLSSESTSRFPRPLRTGRSAYAPRNTHLQTVGPHRNNYRQSRPG